MGTLTGPEIARQVALDRVWIDPYDPELLNPNSIDVRLGPRLLTYVLGPIPQAWPHGMDPVETWCMQKDQVLDVRRDNPTRAFDLPPGGEYVLMPGVLYLGATREVMGSNFYKSDLEGKSSLARLGLEIHVTGRFIDVGFHDHLTLEMTVVHPLRIHEGMRIGQVAFSTLIGEVVLYQGKYKGRHAGPVPSRSWQDYTETEG